MIDSKQSWLNSDSRILSEYAVDFGNISERKPQIVALPRSTSMLRRTLALAREEDLKIVLRGGGQSFYGQSLCERGIVVDMRHLQERAGKVELGDGWVKAPASMLLFDLLNFLRRKGLRLPVYPNVA